VEETPSKSARKRTALAAQALGQRLTTLAETELAALGLPESLLDAVLEARRISSRGGLARQRQYIGKLMRDLDTESIATRLDALTQADALDVQRLRRIERWRERLLRDGDAALGELGQARPDADLASVRRALTAVHGASQSAASRTAASRALFRALRDIF